MIFYSFSFILLFWDITFEAAHPFVVLNILVSLYLIPESDLLLSLQNRQLHIRYSYTASIFIHWFALSYTSSAIAIDKFSSVSPAALF
jgi:hypothetical protein